MCSMTYMCFMCSNNYNCSFVNDRIVTQVEYLMPEITIIKLGIPLRICSVCDNNLQSFNKFKKVCVENSLHLEAKIKEAQSKKNCAAQECGASGTQMLTGSSYMKNDKGEDISIKEEPYEETTHEREFYNDLVQSTANKECPIDNNVHCSKDRDPSKTSNQKFEEIYIKNEPLEEDSTNSEDIDNLDCSKDDQMEIDNPTATDHDIGKTKNTRSFEISENSEDSDFPCTPLETTQTLLPEKSRAKYEKQYDLFMKWCKLKKFKNYTENVLLAYFSEKSKVLKSSTLWSKYSMLKSTLGVKNDIDVNKFKKLTAFLKRKAVGYIPEKSKSLKREEINKFLSVAPDDRYLMMKVALLLGVAGACSRNELVRMTVDDVEDNGSILTVKIPSSKRTFIVDDQVSLYRRYIALRPSHIASSRLFINYKNGKCIAQVVGMNTIGKIPSYVAQYLNLPNPNAFTGHCFRRSSTTLLPNSRARYSSSVAEGESNKKVKQKILAENTNQPIDISIKSDNQEVTENLYNIV